VVFFTSSRAEVSPAEQRDPRQRCQGAVPLPSLRPPGTGPHAPAPPGLSSQEAVTKHGCVFPPMLKRQQPKG